MAADELNAERSLIDEAEHELAGREAAAVKCGGRRRSWRRSPPSTTASLRAATNWPTSTTRPRSCETSTQWLAMRRRPVATAAGSDHPRATCPRSPTGCSRRPTEATRATDRENTRDDRLRARGDREQAATDRLSAIRTSDQATHELAALWLAIETRTVIGQATGVLMERHRLTSDRAFAMVVRLSEHLNMKARDIARRIVAVADQPAVPTEPPAST